jgi:hypothetical protein
MRPHCCTSKARPNKSGQNRHAIVSPLAQLGPDAHERGGFREQRKLNRRRRGRGGDRARTNRKPCLPAWAAGWRRAGSRAPRSSRRATEVLRRPPPAGCVFRRQAALACIHRETADCALSGIAIILQKFQSAHRTGLGPGTVGTGRCCPDRRCKYSFRTEVAAEI